MIRIIVYIPVVSLLWLPAHLYPLHAVPHQKVGLLTPFITLTPSSTSLPQQAITQNEIATPTPAPQVYKVKKDELGSTIALEIWNNITNAAILKPWSGFEFLERKPGIDHSPNAANPCARSEQSDPCCYYRE